MIQLFCMLTKKDPPHKNMERIEIIIFIGLLLPTIYSLARGAPFVLTPMTQVNRMLKAVPMKPGMTLVDLGSGDGRLVHTASIQYGVKAIGYEFSPMVYAWSKFIQPYFMWKGSRAKVLWRNFWTQDLSQVDVVVCYLLTNTLERMEKNLIPSLKPGTWIVSNAFQIKSLKPVKVLDRDRNLGIGRVWVYRVPTAATKALSNKESNQNGRSGQAPEPKKAMQKKSRSKPKSE